MTGPKHYLEAERLLRPRIVHSIPLGEARQSPPTTDMILQAQVHATLALAAATSATGYGEMALRNNEAWDRVCGVQSPCPRCQGRNRETVDMVCQACGRDYGSGSDG